MEFWNFIIISNLYFIIYWRNNITMNQEQKIIFYRTILLDESKPDEERRIAQRYLMEILDIKEDSRSLIRKEVKQV